MQNPLLKNNKTWLYGDLQHRTSHYNKILCARSSYNGSDSPKRQAIFSQVNCKYKSKVEQERRATNQKLVKSLLDISHRSPSHSRSFCKETPSLKNDYVIKEQNNKIMVQNLDLFKRIVHTSSQIGSKKRWRSRKKKLEKYNKLLGNNREAYLNLDQEIYSVYLKLRTKNTSDSMIQVESKLQESQKMISLRAKKKEKFYTDPIQQSNPE